MTVDYIQRTIVDGVVDHRSFLKQTEITCAEVLTKQDYEFMQITLTVKKGIIHVIDSDQSIKFVITISEISND